MWASKFLSLLLVSLVVCESFATIELTRGKERNSKQPQVRRTIRVKESEPAPAPPSETPSEKQPEEAKPQNSVHQSHGDSTNTVDVKPSITIGNQAAPKEATVQSPVPESDEPKAAHEPKPKEADAVKLQIVPYIERPRQAGKQLVPVLVERQLDDDNAEIERNLLQKMLDQESKINQSAKASKQSVGPAPEAQHNTETVHINGVGNHKTMKISNVGNREEIEVNNNPAPAPVAKGAGVATPALGVRAEPIREPLAINPAQTPLVQINVNQAAGWPSSGPYQYNAAWLPSQPATVSLHSWAPAALQQLHQLQALPSVVQGLPVALDGHQVHKAAHWQPPQTVASNMVSLYGPSGLGAFAPPMATGFFPAANFQVPLCSWCNCAHTQATPHERKLRRQVKKLKREVEQLKKEAKEAKEAKEEAKKEMPATVHVHEFKHEPPVARPVFVEHKQEEPKRPLVIVHKAPAPVRAEARPVEPRKVVTTVEHITSTEPQVVKRVEEPDDEEEEQVEWIRVPRRIMKRKQPRHK